jgi:acyl-CoA synthetase (AMP-forming)/AMP-acid ligase II/thioesterase domain-containing protein
MTFQTLQNLLESRAETSPGKIISYPLGNTRAQRVMTYSELLQEARQRSDVLRSLENYQAGSVILLHLSDQLSGIIWFWSVLYAGCLPAMSTPFSNNAENRILHIKHLSEMLKNPLCLTSESLLEEQFAEQTFLQPITIESLEEKAPLVLPSKQGRNMPSPEDTALLMFTSGSTGNAKAVCLSHGQILAAVAGKSTVVPLPADGSLLNWIALDHVASVVEIHIQALFISVDQVHVHAADVIMEPIEFVRLINDHRVSRTFAPNFFLARLRDTLEKMDVEPNWDLSCLRYIATGGEANVTDTGAAVAGLLKKYGAPARTIIPGFGMTETCAGSIFNTQFPDYEIQNNLEFASLGHCMSGIEMRVTSSSDQNSEVGNLEVKGPVVFKEYFNNTSATADAFTHDGWFKTGDLAFVDSSGHLNLVGRTKETLIVNGVKYNPQEIEWAIEEAGISGVTNTFTACFSSLQAGSSTEAIFVVYVPTYSVDDAAARVDTMNAIMQVVMIQTGARPEVLPIDRSELHKSTLGKLSRTKIKRSFEKGDYNKYEEVNRARIAQHRQDINSCATPATEAEEALRKVFATALQLKDGVSFDVTTPIFETGITSIELIRLKRYIEEHLGLKTPIPIITLMTNPTVRSLVAALQLQETSSSEYEPVVVIQPHGTKTPLWLVHPGVGEILVFLNLANHLRDRPVYAFRARGFTKGEAFFADINETLTTYHAAIKRRQPHGPYALAGYSYGSMIAFETAKILESNEDQVSFVGVFNLPPHIKSRMQQLNWTECLLHLAYFLDLITEQHSRELAVELQHSPREEVLANVLTSADRDRLAELALSPLAIVNWANLAYGLQSMAVEYEPSGLVTQMDVFYCTPLAVVASSKEQWLSEHLSKWSNFVRTEVEFHGVGGEHYTMLGKEHVQTFQKTLKKVLAARGL